jgi:transposase InsO family protein
MFDERLSTANAARFPARRVFAWVRQQGRDDARTQSTATNRRVARARRAGRPQLPGWPEAGGSADARRGPAGRNPTPTVRRDAPGRECRRGAAGSRPSRVPDHGAESPVGAAVSYIGTGAGFVYLAVVFDAWSRRVVGSAMPSPLRTELVMDALDRAIHQRRPRQVIHHLDCLRTPLSPERRTAVHWIRRRRVRQRALRQLLCHPRVRAALLIMSLFSKAHRHHVKVPSR